jgi:glycosyltransferase involved in cell wall biosynthesis
MNKRADMFIAVSDAVKNHWINKGINEDKIVRVYNGVKINDNNLKNNNRFNNECIKLVITGSISKTKGQVHAIEVVKRVKDKGYKVKLDIIGDGPTSYVKYLKKIVNLNKLNDIVSFLGYKDNVENCLNEYDVGLICSKDEAFGRVTAEYMMAGLPILASNTGANTELIRDGIDGLLYTYGDDDDMEKKLISIIKAGNRMGGENTHEYAMREFSDVVNAGHIYEVYNDVLRKYEG